MRKKTQLDKTCRLFQNYGNVNLIPKVVSVSGTTVHFVDYEPFKSIHFVGFLKFVHEYFRFG